MNFPSGKLTNGLIAVNVVVFLVILLAGIEQEAFLKAGFFPARLGGEFADDPQFGWMVPAWLTPVSSAFLHSGLMHIGFNMLMLLFCGRFVEHALGSNLMVFLYVVGAYAASLSEYLFNAQSMTVVVGASGAISAVFGAYALLYSRNEVKPVGPIPGHIVRIAWLTVFWIGIQLMIGLATSGSMNGIAIYAHIGGFVAGLLLTRPLLLYRFKNA
ncbi:MAG: rhomboid family intramembrane serine protease [Parasphingorhabdus sp.]